MWHLIMRVVLLFVLLCCLLSEDFAVQASLPETLHGKVVHEDHTQSPIGQQLHHQLNRLPGVCRRLRRRRITVLCNVIKYCSASLGIKSGQLCHCPKGSRCSHFFLKSL